MDSQIDTASPLWLVLAAFALLLIMESHPPGTVESASARDADVGPGNGNRQPLG